MLIIEKDCIVMKTARTTDLSSIQPQNGDGYYEPKIGEWIELSVVT